MGSVTHHIQEDVLPDEQNGTEPVPEPTEQLLTIEEAAKALNLGRDDLRWMLEPNGTVRVVLRPYVRLSDVQEVLEQNLQAQIKEEAEMAERYYRGFPHPHTLLWLVNESDRDAVAAYAAGQDTDRIPDASVEWVRLRIPSQVAADFTAACARHDRKVSDAMILALTEHYLGPPHPSVMWPEDTVAVCGWMPLALWHAVASCADYYQVTSNDIAADALSDYVRRRAAS